MSSAALRSLMGVYAEEAERCIRCGFCNSVCPTTLTSIGYAPSRTSRGRLVMLQSTMILERPRPFDGGFKELIDLCFGCMRCLQVCPAGIPIPLVNSSFRAAYHAHTGGSRISRSERLLSSLGEVAPALNKYPPLWRLLANRLSLRMLKAVAGLAKDAPIPVPEPRSLDTHLRGEQKAGYKLYALFADTYARYIRPSIGLDARHLLNKAGIDIYLPQQHDSGVIHLELGLWDKLRKLAALNTASLYKEAVEGRRILCTSPASTMMLREVYPQLVPGEASKTVADSVTDINELLYELVTEEGITDLRIRGTITLHSSCLSQHLKLTPKVRAVFESLGAQVEEVRTECCGSGGAWGLQRKNRALSVEIGSRLTARLSGTVVSYSETCVEQIRSLGGGRFEAYLPHQAILRMQRP